MDCFTSIQTILSRCSAAVRSPLPSSLRILRASTLHGRLFRIGLLSVLVFLVVALEPAAAQANPVCAEESGTLVDMIEGFIRMTTALGIMGGLVVWQAEELANIFTIDQQKVMALKQHKRGTMKSVVILVLLGPLFTVGGSAMNLPIAQCVDLVPF